MDFTCSIEGGEFTFNDFWEIRQCPNIELEDADIQLTLLTKLPHFNGYSLSPEEEAAIALKIQETVAELDHETDEFGSYIDKNFLEFWDTERSALRQQLLAQVVEAARELCRTGQFDPSLVLRAIRVCKEDPEWLSGYTRFVGGCIYQRANRLKQQINPDFGGLVKAGVGAEVQEDKNGKPLRQKWKARSFNPNDGVCGHHAPGVDIGQRDVDSIQQSASQKAPTEACRLMRESG